MLAYLPGQWERARVVPLKLTTAILRWLKGGSYLSTASNRHPEPVEGSRMRSAACDIRLTLA